MTSKRPAIAAACIMAAALLMLPADADAQRRGAVRGRVSVPRVGVPRVGVPVGRPRAAVVVSAFPYRPYYYGSYYGSYYGPYLYDSLYYSPYAQWNVGLFGRRYDDSASLQLQVRPRQTEVFVDGYYAGTVDDFDGWLQRLHLEPGEHDIELFLPGHRIHVESVYLQPTRSSRIRHDMVPIGAGDPPVGQAHRPTTA